MKNRESQVSDWIKFYKDLFGIDIAINDEDIPKIPRKKEKKFPRLIIVPRGVKTLEILNKSRKLFDLYFCDDKFISGVISERDSSKKLYCVWVDSLWDPKDELIKISYVDAKSKGIKCITFAERLLFGLFVFWKHGKHIDTHTSTACFGSLYKCDKHIYTISVWYNESAKKVFIGFGLKEDTNFTAGTRSVIC